MLSCRDLSSGGGGGGGSIEVQRASMYVAPGELLRLCIPKVGQCCRDRYSAVRIVHKLFEPASSFPYLGQSSEFEIESPGIDYLLLLQYS